jgi:hypothetical protein
MTLNIATSKATRVLLFATLAVLVSIVLWRLGLHTLMPYRA